MKLLTEEQYNKSKQWEQAFRWALKSNFVGLKTSEFQQVMVIYEEVFGEGLNSRQMSCNTCRLNALKKLGQVFNDTKALMEKKEEEDKEDKAVPEKKKPGRPKKIDI